MSTSVVFPVNKPKQVKMIMDPRPYFKPYPSTTIFKVLIRAEHNAIQREWMYVMKLGNNVFKCLRTGLRFKIGTGGGSKLAFREIGSNPKDMALYIYEVYECDSIITISKEELINVC